MATDKYKEFRNLMFNELGITKGDIRQWTKEAALEAAERRARDVDVEAIVKHEIAQKVREIIVPNYGNPSRAVREQIQMAVAETLAKRITISTTT